MRHLFTALGGLLAAGLLASASPAATVFATPSTLDATVRAAACGDTVILAGTQPFGASRALAGRLCPANSPLTLDGQGRAQVGAWYVTNLAGVSLKGATWAGLRLDAASDLSVTDIAVISAFGGRPGGPPQGLAINGGRNITLARLNVAGFQTGVALVRVDGFSLTDSLITDMAADGVQVAAAWRGVIAANTIKDFAPFVVGTHRDGIQLRPLAGVTPTSDIVIAGNTLSVPWGQGISLTDASAGGGDRITVSDNILEVGLSSGVGLSAVRAAVARNNTITNVPDGSQWVARFQLAADAIHCGNTAAAWGGKPAQADGACAAGTP